MEMEWFALLFHLLSLVQCLTAHLDLPLGAKCQDEWVCTTQDMCSALGDILISRPQICSFNDDQPILCCPPTKHSPNSNRISTPECTEPSMCYYISKKYVESTDQKINFAPTITGGYPVSPGSHRHMALIGYGDSLSSVKWSCGGSVISDNFILSAAHCAENNAGQVASWVKVGDLDLQSETDDAKPETLRIIQRIIHPDFKPPVSYNDIALFRLERYLSFNFWVGPVCLHTEPEVPTTHATVTGWGRTDFVGEASPQLLAVDVPLVASSQCKKLLGTSSKIPNSINADTMICAGEKEGGKDACVGDSGGPMIINSTTCQKIQIGIVSFGRMCALPSTPGVYTRIYPFIPWIKLIVWP